MQKPPSLPEQPQPDDTPTHEPPLTDEDTQPTAAKPAALPKRPDIIPPPPGNPAQPPVVRRRIKRRGRRGGWWAALGIGLLLSLIIALVSLLFLLVYTPEYFEPFIPGRAQTRTAEAVFVRATQNALATREAALVQTQQQAAANAAATGTAIIDEANARATQEALNVQGTQTALVQTATGAAVAFDATRTRVALEAQTTAAARTLEAVRDSFTQTAAAQSVQATGAAVTQVAQGRATATEFARLALGTQAAATVNARQAGPVIQSRGSEPTQVAVATAADSRFNLFFADDFEDGLDAAWANNGGWRTLDGLALSDTCGGTLLVGTDSWQNFAVEVTAQNPSAQFAVVTGYGDGGRLFINFGLGGALWWLVDGETAITDQLMTRVYDADGRYTVEVRVQQRVVTVLVDGSQIAERLLPEAARGPVGLYTCPSDDFTPVFDDFRVVRLPVS